MLVLILLLNFPPRLGIQFDHATKLGTLGKPTDWNTFSSRKSGKDHIFPFLQFLTPLQLEKTKSRQISLTTIPHEDLYDHSQTAHKEDKRIIWESPVRQILPVLPAPSICTMEALFLDTFEDFIVLINPKEL